MGNYNHQILLKELFKNRNKNYYEFISINMIQLILNIPKQLTIFKIKNGRKKLLDSNISNFKMKKTKK